jgi:hypothetical protein
MEKAMSIGAIAGSGNVDLSATAAGIASKPAGAHPSGGRAPAASGGSGGSASGSSSKVYDKKDANKDGKVSAMEAISYDAAHPKTSPAGRSNLTLQQDIGNNVDVTV